MKTMTTFAARSLRAHRPRVAFAAVALGIAAGAMSSFVAGADRPQTDRVQNAVGNVDAMSANHASEIRWFNNRPIRPGRTIRMKVTAYSPDARSCGTSADGITASGFSVLTNGGKLVAADTRMLPFGSLLSIEGYDCGRIVPVLDRGGAIKGHRLDVLFPTHEEARQWGVRMIDVIIWEYADGRGTQFRRGEH